MRWAGIGLFCTLRILATAAVRDVRFTSILLKNSNFGLDHNLEDRGQPQRKFP